MIIRGPGGTLHVRAENDIIDHQLFPIDCYSEAWIEDDAGNELFRGPGNIAIQWAIDYHSSKPKAITEEM